MSTELNEKLSSGLSNDMDSYGTLNITGSISLSDEHRHFVPIVSKLYESCRKIENGHTVLDGMSFIDKLEKMGMRMVNPL